MEVKEVDPLIAKEFRHLNSGDWFKTNDNVIAMKVNRGRDVDSIAITLSGVRMDLKYDEIVSPIEITKFEYRLARK